MDGVEGERKKGLETCRPTWRDRASQRECD
jgi:hypothetical protein